MTETVDGGPAELELRVTLLPDTGEVEIRVSRDSEPNAWAMRLRARLPARGQAAGLAARPLDRASVSFPLPGRGGTGRRHPDRR